VLPATPDNPLGILSQQGFSARALATEAYWQRAVYQHYAGPPDPPIPAPADSLATNINNAVSQLRLEKARVEQLSTGNVDAELVGFVRKRMGSIERVAQLLEQMLGKLPREVRDRELTADELERLQEVNEDYLFSSASDNDEFKQQVQGVMNELDDVKPLRELHGRLIGRYVPRSFPWPLVEEESP
jgi:chorismate mutase